MIDATMMSARLTQNCAGALQDLAMQFFGGIEICKIFQISSLNKGKSNEKPEQICEKAA
jgi:hypothetical protein